jgi:hypothetical protein
MRALCLSLLLLMKRIALLSAITVALAVAGCHKTIESLHWKSFDQATHDGVTDIKLTGRTVDSGLCGDISAREFIATGPTHSVNMGDRSLLHGWACPDRLHFSTSHQAGPPSNVELPDWKEFDTLGRAEAPSRRLRLSLARCPQRGERVGPDVENVRE